MASSPVVAVEAPESSSAIGRMLGALFSPRKTFESIARRPTWLPPVILACLLALVVVALFSHRVGWRSYLDKQVANSSRFQQLPADQQQRTMEAQLKWTPRVAYAEVIIAPFAGALVLAGIFLGVLNGLGGTRFNFKTSLGIVSYSWMPNVISGLLGIVVLLVKDPATIDLQNLVASNAGAFLADNSPKWLVALLTPVDLFSFWVMILLGIGYSAAAPKKLSFMKAFSWIFSLWVVYVLVRVGLTAAFS
ncbi:MAG TPA: YIP1 family protein [Candidatus Acidoferrales bacterium]|nr:YIP1 family protein [Candidatus Acidoferrales bacterium]